ncbi:hypothetical protein AAJ76_5700026807 [Vairimorpha ceranae]|uniref:Uncharacterized protein n=1 Tax=Vairimorpha ceranae TaxID=40302 RepID=A0A0F9Z9X2_9MICR|nr:hypothetical protein AAJ76_5700026807 [Vairimorpha ceranae]KKO74599.1 hypothetical protein AAJ76_5700026807 [Vairimorpha ceranae]
MFTTSLGQPALPACFFSFWVKLHMYLTRGIKHYKKQNIIKKRYKFLKFLLSYFVIDTHSLYDVIILNHFNTNFKIYLTINSVEYTLNNLVIIFNANFEIQFFIF